MFVLADYSSFGIIEHDLIWPWNFVDIDGDCDYDLTYLVFSTDTPVRILMNEGTATDPDFADVFTQNPYGITLPASVLDPINLVDGVTPAFADLDMDCDLDLVYNGAINGQPDDGYFFAENTGTYYDPSYDLPVRNDYGIQWPGGNYHQSTFVDLDCDGDLDMYAIIVPELEYRYYENTPDAAGRAQFTTPPQFGYPIDTVGFSPMSGSYWDHGGDGDLDLLCGGSTGIRFWENTADNCNYSPPIAGFDFTQNGQDFTFANKSTGNPTDWLWTFDDGETSTEQNPTYTCSGDFKVCLEVSNEFACHGICKEISCMIGSTQDSRLDATLILAPNPTDGKLNMSIQSTDILGEFQWQIFDPMGKMVLTHQRMAGTEHSETIDVSELPPGAYLLKINSEGKSLAQKILKISP